MKQTGDYRRWRPAPELAEYAAIASVRANELAVEADEAEGIAARAYLHDRAERFRLAAIAHRKNAQRAAHSLQGVFC